MGGLEVSRVTAPSIRSYMQIFSRFGLTWHRKVNFSTFSGKLRFQSTRNGSQNLPFCPGPLQDTFIIFSSISHQHIYRKYFPKKKTILMFDHFFLTTRFFFGFSKNFPWRPRGRPTKNKFGRQGRISRLPEGSQVNGPLNATNEKLSSFWRFLER